jgi:hypothetical protein
LNSPRRPTAATLAAMNDAEVQETLAFNTLGQKRCGWRP